MHWKNFQPLLDWVVVKADARPHMTKGGIVLPDQPCKAERVMEGTGRILRVGDRSVIREKIGEDLEPGMRVCYRKFLEDTFCEFDRDADQHVIFLISARDLLAVIDSTVQMGVFS